MSKTLLINITALNPDQFAKDPASTATEATVSTNGNIDIHLVEDSVVISWTFNSDLNEVFRPLTPPPGPIKFAVRPVTAPPTLPGAGIFSTPSLSNSNRTVMVTVTNDQNQTEKNFQYTIYENHGPDDPSIRNR